MRIATPPLAVTAVAGAFVAGWITASSVDPPTAVTQSRAAAPMTPLAEVEMPRITLDLVAPRPAPSSHRNPFAFVGTRPAPTAPGAAIEHDTVAADRATPAESDAVMAPAPPRWRVIGVASHPDGGFTAVLSGAGDVHLVSRGDRLPDGATLVDVTASEVVIELDGRREMLRLP